MTPTKHLLFADLAVFQPTIEDRVQDSLQVCLLLLPPANRRKLHLLLRLMHKIINNKHMRLDDQISTRKLVCLLFSEYSIHMSGSDTTMNKLRLKHLLRMT